MQLQAFLDLAKKVRNVQPLDTSVVKKISRAQVDWLLNISHVVQYSFQKFHRMRSMFYALTCLQDFWCCLNKWSKIAPYSSWILCISFMCSATFSIPFKASAIDNHRLINWLKIRIFQAIRNDSIRFSFIRRKKIRLGKKSRNSVILWIHLQSVQFSSQLFQFSVYLLLDLIKLLTKAIFTDQVLMLLASFVSEISKLLQKQRILEYSLDRLYQIRF